MAVSVNTNPNGTINLLSAPVAFEFTMTGIVSGNIRKRFGYQAFIDGTPITPVESTAPVEGQKFLIDFTQDVRALMDTPAPDPNVVDQDTTNVLREFTLNYWEINYNVVTCQEESTVLNSLGPYNILNSTYQYYDGLGNPYNSIIMSIKPSVLEICRTAADFLYIWSGGNTPIQLIAISNSGTTNITTSSATGLQAKRISVEGLRGIIPAADIAKIEVFVFAQLLCTYIITDCCEESQEIYFLSSGGGYQSLIFDKLKYLNLSDDLAKVNKYQRRTSTFGQIYSEDVRTIGGLSMVNKTSFRSMTLEKEIDNEDTDFQRYIADFLASPSYFYRGPQGIIKVIKDKADTRYAESESFFTLSIKFTINQPVQIPNVIQ